MIAEFDALMRREPVELLLLHPLPFEGRFWEEVEGGLGDVAMSAPTIYSLGDTMPEVAQAVLDGVEGDRLIVVGNSIGGSCALEVAVAAPDRVEHLVLVGTKAGHRPEPDYRDWALNLLAAEGVEALWGQVWEPLFSAETERAVVMRARDEALAVPADLLAAGIALFHGRPDRTHVIDEWPKPITFVVGADDTAPKPQVSEEMAKRAQHGELRVVPGCGHYVPIERPDAMVAILGEVLASLISPG